MIRYAFRYRSPDYMYPALCELTAQELRDEEAKAGPGGWPRYERTTAERARRWVQDNGHHETALYVTPSGHVRYAKDWE